MTAGLLGSLRAQPLWSKILSSFLTAVVSSGKSTSVQPAGHGTQPIGTIAERLLVVCAPVRAQLLRTGVLVVLNHVGAVICIDIHDLESALDDVRCKLHLHHESGSLPCHDLQSLMVQWQSIRHAW